MPNTIIGPVSWWRGRKIHRLCDRWRAAMRELGESEAVWEVTDAELLVGMRKLVSSHNPGASADQLVAGALWTLEASVTEAERRLEERRSG